MATPMRDDDTLGATDDVLVDPVPEPPSWTGHTEAPEPDLLEQLTEVAAGWRLGRPSTAFDAPEADALDQATDIPAEADDR